VIVAADHGRQPVGSIRCVGARGPLRHACGFALANAGHDTRALQAYLGHRNIQHTVRYTELAPNRFKDFWR
jgi:site-specific recombinase XerD